MGCFEEPTTDKKDKTSSSEGVHVIERKSSPTGGPRFAVVVGAWSKQYFTCCSRT